MLSLLLLTVIGITPLSNSSFAISKGSVFSVSISTGAPKAICKALAPMIRAFSNRVYLKGKVCLIGHHPFDGAAEI